MSVSSPCVTRDSNQTETRVGHAMTIKVILYYNCLDRVTCLHIIPNTGGHKL